MIGDALISSGEADLLAHLPVAIGSCPEKEEEGRHAGKKSGARAAHRGPGARPLIACGDWTQAAPRPRLPPRTASCVARLGSAPARVPSLA
jgi:hypothetical protein